MRRIVEPELLDGLPREDPRAIRSRRDLRRVNVLMRNHSVMADALRRLQPGIRPDEESLLQAFDSHREQICVAAMKVYKRGNKGSYELGPTDF